MIQIVDHYNVFLINFQNYHHNNNYYYYFKIKCKAKFEDQDRMNPR